MKSWLNFDGYFRVSVRFVAYSLFAGNDTEIHEPNLPKGGSVQRRNSHPGSPGALGGPPRAGGPRPGQGKKFVYFSFSYQKDKNIKILNFTCGW